MDQPGYDAKPELQGGSDIKASAVYGPVILRSEIDGTEHQPQTGQLETFQAEHEYPNTCHREDTELEAPVHASNISQECTVTELENRQLGGELDGNPRSELAAVPWGWEYYYQGRGTVDTYPEAVLPEQALSLTHRRSLSPSNANK
jgi:hypothetical protein